MEQLWMFPILAVVIEALTEYIKTVAAAKSRKTMVIQLGALVLGIVTCTAARADLFAAVGIEFGIPWMGCAFTGVFVSRGANYMSDLLKMLNGISAGKKEEAV